MPALTKVSLDLGAVRLAMDEPRIIGLEDGLFIAPWKTVCDYYRQ